MPRPYRILKRAGKQTTGRACYQIGVPWQIAEAIPQGVEFDPEMTPAGILFRPRLPQVEAPIQVRDLPTWARELREMRDVA